MSIPDSDYTETLPIRSTFLMLGAKKRAGISRVGVYKGRENCHLGWLICLRSFPRNKVKHRIFVKLSQVVIDQVVFRNLK